jgi:peptidoglycan hydrolase-like protein with peptidoglycan-binding domain
MKGNPMRKIVIAASLLAIVSSTTTVQAQQRLVEGIIGIGGALIINEINNRQRTNAPRPRQVDPAEARRIAAERDQMRLVQTRLNALGFDAGTADGLVGPRTRNAISDFQMSIGAVPTGRLTAAEQTMLMEQSTGFGAAPNMAAAAAPPVAFPALGTAAPASAPPAAFPALGASPMPPTQAGNFPALATPAPTLGTPAFPTLAEPEVAAAPSMPLVAGSAQASAAALTRSSLEAEVAQTPFGSLDAQPAVLGITLGADGTDFAAMLEENGFTQCTGSASAQQCTRQTATLFDTVKGWIADDGVWAIARLIQFNEPVPADFLHAQFAETYPELMEAPNGLISSGEGCVIAGSRVPQLAAVLDQRAPGEVTSDLLTLADQCPVAWSLAFNEGNGLVAAVQVLMLDGTSVVRQHLADKTSRETQIGADLKF